MGIEDTINPLARVGRSWWVLLIYGLFAIIFGVIAIASPIAAAAALAWSFGVLALAEGIASVFALFGQHTIPKGWLALYALVSIVFGVLTIVNPVATAGVLLLFLAAWLVVGGIYRIVFAIRVRKSIEGEWLIALSGVVAIVLGLLLAFNPLSGIVVTTIWIGVIAIFYGVLQVVAAFRVRKFKSL